MVKGLEKNVKKLVILGNGPSLKGFDLRQLDNVDSLGMNAAYRFWERIDWYPTHYVCLDDQLIETHADAIYDLITTSKVKTAFLIARILDYHPDLLTYKNVFYLESFHGARQKRVADKGIPYIDSLPFKESDASKVTTGAYSVRFAAHLGYRQISILGVDLRYVEIIPEAKNEEGIKLVLTKTPESNPNYFFDDYQRVGDKYNIPNPASHGRSLHISAFEVLANDVVQFGWSANIFNSNKKSVLYDKAIFPYVDVGAFISKRRLSAVVVPTTPREIDQIERNIEAWDKPLLSPSLHPDLDNKPDLVFAFNCSEDPELTRKIVEAVQKTSYVKRCFAKIEVLYVKLDKTLDYYEKDYTKKINGRGYKSGPNEQFFELMAKLSYYSGFVFYMETDCIPLRQGWLDEVRALAESDQESWVVGSYYRGLEKISNRFAMHLNGNALYRVGSAEFIEFIAKFWRPRLYKVIDTIDKRMAYDCFLSYFLTAADPRLQNVEWKTLQAIGHRFRATSLIQNISGGADRQQDPAEIVRRLLTQSPTTFFAHGVTFQRLLNEKLDEFRGEEKRPFYWGEIIGEVPIESGQSEYDWRVLEEERSMRLLMIDSTPVGHASATGQLKKTLLGNWPHACFLQIWETGGQASSLRSIQLGQSIESSRATTLSLDDTLEGCRKFDPDVIYFRPVDSDVLFEAAERIVASLGKPLVIHMMDDWPERLRLTDVARFDRLDKALRRLLDRADRRLSICQAMSDAYRIRYGGNWLPLANGVDPTEFPTKSWTQRPPVTQSAPFVIRYMGGLADDMTYASVRDIAVAVASLQTAFAVRFQVYTMEWYRAKAERDIGEMPGVSVGPLVDNLHYRRLLAEADALVIAYNFDHMSAAYIGLSLANKMPECLASGAPLLAYGPLDVATIRYLKDAGCAQVVERNDSTQLCAAITALIIDSELCRRLAEQARGYVAANLTKEMVQKRFREYLAVLRHDETHMTHSVVGPFERHEKAHYDETDCIARIFESALTGRVLIDVGAHHGWADAPFLDNGWRIFAFEPNHHSRAKLLERLAKHKNKSLVALDTRGVSNKSPKGVFSSTSQESSGISGRSAFHESDVETTPVDTTTLTAFFEDKPLPGVDFLKTDTDGHDLFVLQGFPWDRGKPAVIECKFEDSKTVPLGYTFHDMARFLYDKGYTVYVSEWHPITRHGIRHDWRHLIRYPCELVDSKGWGSLLAFREPIDEKVLIAAVRKVLKVGVIEGNPRGTGDTTKALAPLAKPPLAQPTRVSVAGFCIEPSPFFTRAGCNQWRYAHSEATQKLWVASINTNTPTGGSTFAGGLRLQADRAMTLNVSLGRHGKTKYEGASQRIRLLPGVAQQVKLSKAFTHAHTALKLQAEVVELAGGGEALLTIDDLYVNESLASIRLRVGEANVSLREANRRLRDGDAATAMGLYLLLHQQRPLKMYPDNALMVARKLGMGAVESVEELLQRVGG